MNNCFQFLESVQKVIVREKFTPSINFLWQFFFYFFTFFKPLYTIFMRCKVINTDAQLKKHGIKWIGWKFCVNRIFYGIVCLICFSFQELDDFIGHCPISMDFIQITSAWAKFLIHAIAPIFPKSYLLLYKVRYWHLFH